MRMLNTFRAHGLKWVKLKRGFKKRNGKKIVL